MVGKKRLGLGGFASDHREMKSRVQAVNAVLAAKTYFSTQRLNDYDKMLTQAKFQSSKYYELFLEAFMSVAFFNELVGLGLSPFVPQEKDINSLTQTVFYSSEMMSRQSYRQEFEFEKECINQMARTTLRQHSNTFGAAKE